VGQLQPNAWGVYDMHGNVREWCADAWHDNYTGAPTDGRAWEEVKVNDERLSRLRRVYRGGSWDSFAAYVRSASRNDPSIHFRISFVGVRVVVAAVRTL